MWCTVRYPGGMLDTSGDHDVGDGKTVLPDPVPDSPVVRRLVFAVLGHNTDYLTQ